MTMMYKALVASGEENQRLRDTIARLIEELPYHPGIPATEWHEKADSDEIRMFLLNGIKRLKGDAFEGGPITEEEQLNDALNGR